MNKFTYMSLGAGVQSGTMAEMIVEGDLPKPDLVIFADTKDEPQYVYNYVDYLRGRLDSVGVELVTVSAGNLPEALMSGKKRFAAIPAFTVNNGVSGRLKRQCTSDYKIAPIENEVRRQLLSLGYAKQDKRGIVVNSATVVVEAWLGISLDEVARMKQSRSKFITNRWPLIEKRMRRHDCIAWLQDRNLPVPSKSSCRICPYHNNNYWRSMRDKSPDDWQWVVDFDKSLRDSRAARFVATATGTLYLHSSLIPLDEVDLRTPQERGQMELFESTDDVCDEGYCFI